MLLHENNDFTLERDGRFLCATLKRPHWVLSNCHVNGGLREDLTPSNAKGKATVAPASPWSSSKRS
ncbi:hypothetical protein [Candidatus Thiosymbion oneisti]|uniref:hypothetical protein n=1 Tax=Candidatus Thiosymbion oneisti TaxID=589554 RepID=UPI00114CF2A7|nr:hypothetical protein [Candidatus Thiosymbion oneisti]